MTHSSLQFGRMVLLMSALGTVTIAAGCSDAGGYTPPSTLVQITGQVTLDGEPLSGATVNFLPLGGTAGTGGFAVTDAAGQFQALHYSMEPGLSPGTYNVTFSKLLTAEGQPLPDGVDAADMGAMESLPPHLSQVHPENHRLKLTVDNQAQTINYELKSKGGR